MRATVDLRDGSRIVGEPQQDSIKLTNALATLDLPLARVRGLSFEEPGAEAALSMRNGDIIKGRVPDGGFPVESVLGELVLPWAQVEEMRFSLFGGTLLPAGEGPLAFGGVNWSAWRVEAEGRDDKLITLPRARAGFAYGHGGNGRGATLVTNVGNEEWTDYRVEFDVVLAGVDPAFNPHRVGAHEIGVAVMFHIADLKESWNEKGTSCYSFSMSPKGTWRLRSIYNHHCPGGRGYRSPVNDGINRLAEGAGVVIAKRKVNRMRLEVVGKRIRIWVDDEQMVDFTDDKMDEEIGGVTLDHGGVAIQFGYEAMGWIENFSAVRL